MNKIPCAVIKDLLPSYIDGLTSEDSNQMIEEHLSECAECTEMLSSMKAGLSKPDEDEKKEIDYLKKNRRRNKWIIFSCAAAVLIMLAVLFVTRYMTGEHKSDLNGEYFLWEVQTDGSRLELDAWTTDDIYRVTGFKITESEGILYVEADVVPSGAISRLIYGRKSHTEYTSGEPFHQVMINGRILWSDGEEISTAASRLFILRHEYVGDAPRNGQTARALNIHNYLGPYYNELETREIPYGWNIHLTRGISAELRETCERDMRSFAYAMLATTGNLDQVIWHYNADGSELTQTVTKEDASSFLGQDIKSCYEDVNLLNKLIRMTGLDRYAFGSEWSDSNYIPVDAFSEHNSIINIVSNADEDIAGITVRLFIDGEEAVSMEAKNHNSSHAVIEKGDLLQAGIGQEFFPDSGDSLMELKFSVITSAGEAIDIEEGLRIPANNYTRLFDIQITGNAQDGFSVIQ